MAVMPTQAQTLAWTARRWPDRVAPIWRAAKLGEEAGEVLGAVIKMGEGRKSIDDLRMEAAQVVICAMALAESADFDLEQAIADEWARVGDGPMERADTPQDVDALFDRLVAEHGRRKADALWLAACDWWIGERGES